MKASPFLALSLFISLAHRHSFRWTACRSRRQ